VAKISSSSPRPASANDAKHIQIPSSSPATRDRIQRVGASPEAHKPSPSIRDAVNSNDERLLTALWPSPERVHQIGILDRQTHRFKNLPVKDAADAIAQAQKLSSAGHEAYFACAEYLTPDSRAAANATGASGFWLDIDCGEGKAATGKGYATVDHAVEALRQFCTNAVLSKPTHIVHSGGGMHVYWVLDREIPRDMWLAYARMLKAMTNAFGLLADGVRTADIASVLRVPGTLNHKFTPPRPVSLIHASAEFIEQSVMLKAIAAAHDKLFSVPAPTTPRDSTNAPTAASAHAYGSPDIERLASALAVLDPDCDEGTWKLRRLAPLAWAAHDHPDLSIALYELARSWSSGALRGKPSRAWVTPGGNGLTGEQAFDSTWDRFLNANYTGVPTTPGTIFHDAMQVGWVDPGEQFHLLDGAALPQSGKRTSNIDVKALKISPPVTLAAGAQALPKATATAAGAPTTPPPDDEVIARLAAMKPLEYERVRVEVAKQLGFRTAVLDAHVKAARQQDVASGDLPFQEVDPHPDPVDPALLLDEVSAAIRRFVVMDDEQADAAVLWVAHTWFIDVVQVAPLAIINAPEKACGKSLFLDVMGRMTARPLPVSNVSTAALFRSVELWQPTLLIDEADTFIRENDELKGLINAGHTRANAFVLRLVGDNHEPRRFSVWGAKALAGITLEKHLPDSTMSRAVVINLRRKLPHEVVERLRHAEPGLFDDLASRLARFADDHAPQVRRARPALPEALNDRAHDNWEPLLAIAECAGPEWVRRATAAALKLSGAGDEAVSTGNELLADLQEVFESKQVEKIKTTDLLEALVADEEKPWATHNRGKPLTPHQLAKMLAAYGITSKTVRFGAHTPKGYDLSQFADAFARYLPEVPQRRNDGPEASAGETGGVADGDAVAATPTGDATPGPMPGLGCGGVADGSGVGDGACAGRIPPLSNPEDLF
jgi:putative DNA primase/helicase